MSALQIVPMTEEERLRVVDATEMLDTAPDAEFDELVQLTAEICATPISLFTLVGRERQWFKAKTGIAISSTPRETSFCTHAIRQNALMVVEDAKQDVRFKENPLVVGGPKIRFYAGVPLEGDGGALIGTLCVIDTVPRRLTESQRHALIVLASQVRTRIQLRVQQQALIRALSAQEALLAELGASEQRFKEFMHNSPFVAFIKDAEGRYLFYNERFAERFGITAAEWLGKDDHDLWSEDLAKNFRANDVEVMRAGRVLERLEETIGVDGRHASWKSYKFPWQERGATLLGGIAIELTEEIARQKALEDANLQLAKLATTDMLTGLSNRRVLDERVEFEFRFSQRHKTHLSVVLLDLDDFKRRNDELGHAAGDEALRRTGRIIAETIRTTDTAARYGGEEFVVLLPGADTQGAMLFVRRLQDAMIAEPWAGTHVTASLGLASFDATTTSGAHLVARADDAMYLAKRSGRNCVVTHQQMLQRAMDEARVASHPKDSSS